MKTVFTTLFALMATLALYGQHTKPDFELQRTTGDLQPSTLAKMMCENDNPLRIVSCEGETADNGDNDPSNGAFMTWVATGSPTTLYYSRIYNGPDTFQIVRTGTSNSVYPPSENDGISYSATIAIGGNSTNQCLEPGLWTVQVWTVLDENNDLMPDRDEAGNVIGCFVTCEYDFAPSCPDPNGTRFDVEERPADCDSGGRLRVTNIEQPQIYCTDANGTNVTITWTGPNGYTGTGPLITGLEAGTYTAMLTDFYGCVSSWTGDVTTLPVLTISCADGDPPSTVAGADGTGTVTIMDGTGDYTIEWDGPTSGSTPGADGDNLLDNLEVGTYTITVIDDDSDCETTCTITVVEPECDVDFEVSVAENGDVTVTPLTGIPPFQLAYVGPNNRPASGSFGFDPIFIPAVDLPPGDYDFYLIEADRTGCFQIVSVTIEEADCSDMEITLVAQTGNDCPGDNDGYLEIAVTGGENPIVTWEGPGVTGSSSLTQSNLAPGTYNVFYSDDRNCEVPATFEFNNPDALNLSCGAVRETFDDGDDGRIGYAIGGGTPPYRIAYTATDENGNALPPLAATPTAAQDSLFNLQAGTYVLTLTDANDCSQTCTAVVTQPNCVLNPVCSVINPPTNAGTGFLDVALDGTGPYTITISGALDTVITSTTSLVSLAGLGAGDYLVEAFNAEGCVGSCSATITIPTCELTFAGARVDPTCNGGSDGSITLTIEGAADGLVIDWSDDTFDGLTEATGLAAGNYTVSVTDETNCPVAPITFAVRNPDPIMVDITVDESVACTGSDNAALTAVVSNTAAPLNYAWNVDSFPNAASVTGLASGDYAVTVTDGDNCTGIGTVTLTNPGPASISCSSTDETAAGLSDGTLSLILETTLEDPGGQVVVTGPNGTITLPPNDTILVNLAPGVYTATLTTNNGCIAECSSAIAQGGCDLTVDIQVTQPDCDTDTGSATAVVTDANGAVTFEWNNSANTATITDLNPGEISVVVTDEENCQRSATASVVPFTNVPGITDVSATASCPQGGCTELSFTASGVTPISVTFTYLQSNGTRAEQNLGVNSPGANSIQLCASDLGLTTLEDIDFQLIEATDNNGCSRPLDIMVEIEVPDPAVGVLDTFVCPGDSLTIFGETLSAIRPTTEVVLSGAAANGCDSTLTINLDFYEPATGNLTPVVCFGEGFEYEGVMFDAFNPTGEVVLPGASAAGCDSTVFIELDFFPLVDGVITPTICSTETYTLAGEVFDVDRPTDDVLLPGASINGCDSTVRVILQFYEESVGNLNPAVCSDGSFTYEGETFDANRPSGEVVLGGASSNGCDSTVMVTLSFLDNITEELDTALCAGETFTVLGETFDESRLTGDILLPGASTQGCDSTLRVTVSYFPAAEGTLDTTVCAGTVVMLHGQTFTESNPAGSALLEGASANGCDSTLLINVTYLAPALGALDTMLCAGSTLTLGNVTFSVDNPVGDVVLSGAAASGCDSTVSVSVSYPPPAVSALDTIICLGESLTLGGQTFTTAQTELLVPVAELSSVGCDSSVLLNLSVVNPGFLTLSGDEVICADGDLTVTVTNTGNQVATFSLSFLPGEPFTVAANGVTEITRPATPGTLVTLTDVVTAGNCPPATSGSLTVRTTDLSVTVDVESGDGIFAVSCNDATDGMISARTTGGIPPYSYTWSSGSTGSSLRDLPAGRYAVTVTSARGCSAEAESLLEAPDLLVATVGEVSATCLDQTPRLILRELQGGTGPYLASTDPETPLLPLTGANDTLLAAIGEVLLTVEDANGCVLLDTFDLSPPPIAELIVTPPNAVIRTGESVEMVLTTNLAGGLIRLTTPDSILADNRLTVAPQEATTYVFTVTDETGCTATASGRVLIDDFIPIYAPTAFSPNDDGVNDIYRIFPQASVASFTNFYIFDRWGNSVWERVEGFNPLDPANQDIGWDGGLAEGRPRPPGVYVYTLDVITTDGRTLPVKGEITLLR